MANKPANRPAVGRKTVSRHAEKARQEAQSQGVAITVNGKTYTLMISHVSAVDARAFREQVGVPLMRVFNSEDDWDVDWIAGVVWLARRLDGERNLKWDEVAAEISYDTDIDMAGTNDEVVEGEVVTGDPEG